MIRPAVRCSWLLLVFALGLPPVAASAKPAPVQLEGCTLAVMTGTSGIGSCTGEAPEGGGGGTELPPSASDVEPSKRAGASAAYDPVRREVVLFGGEVGEKRVWDGAKWNVVPGEPLADTWVWDGEGWTRREPPASPASRSGAAMAWDAADGRIVLFGGRADETLGDTWAWDGATWERLQPTASPPARSAAALAADPARGDLVLFGGAASGGTALGDTWTWSEGTWRLRQPAVSLSARSGAASAAHEPSGSVVLFGGCCDENGGDLADTWTWDGQTWTAAEPAISPPARAAASMASMGRDTILFGGVVCAACLRSPWDPTLAPREHDGVAWRWDGSSWSDPQEGEALPEGRKGAVLAYDPPRDQVLMFGGRQDRPYAYVNGYIGITYLNDTWILDASGWRRVEIPAAGRWQQVRPWPDERVSPGLVFDEARGEVLLHGGINDGGYLSDTWAWTGMGWEERHPPLAPPARYGAALAYDAARQRVVLFGGLDAAEHDPLNDTWSWDGERWSKLHPVNRPSPRFWTAMAYDAARERVVLFGGLSQTDVPSAEGYLADTWTWDGEDWTLEEPVGSPSARSQHSMTYDAALGSVVLFGGHAPGAGRTPAYQLTLNDVWLWDGAAWTPRGAGPSPRYDAAMTYDAARREVVLYSGRSPAGPLADTWTWDGAAWLPEPAASSPGARGEGGMTYDAVREQVVLFGGGCGGFVQTCVSPGRQRDLWVWDGQGWTERPRPSSPPARADGSLAFHTASGKVVLFGGYQLVQSPSGTTPVAPTDTWLYDGERWEQVATAPAPPGRIWTAMAYDAARGEAVLFGGCPGTSCSSSMGDTWLWDGSAWRAAAPTAAPSARYGAVMGYDPARERIVLFGGVSSACGCRVADTWTWDGATWRLESPSDSPAGRALTGMAWHAGTERLVLFGGSTNASGTAGDTWTWDGETWRQEHPPSAPSPRVGASVASDPRTGNVTVFGGIEGYFGPGVRDTWVWDGSTWVEQDAPPGPPGRWFAASAGLPPEGGVLLLGGLGGNPGVIVGDAWLWRGAEG